MFNSRKATRDEPYPRVEDIARRDDWRLWQFSQGEFVLLSNRSTFDNDKLWTALDRLVEAHLK